MDTKALLNNKKFIKFLETKAAFRTLSNTQLAIYTGGNGIFTREGRIRTNDPEKIGKFVCIISFDENNYKKDLDNIQKLWEWKCNRNEKRGVLEEHFGHDTKHMSHTIRLLIGGLNILETGEYHPRLEGENLKLVRNVLNGEFTYDYLVDYASKLEKKLDTKYSESTLPKTPNHKKANELLLELSRKF